MRGPYDVLIYNPNGMIDTARLQVGTFDVETVFAAMVDRKWTFQPDETYVAIKVEAGTWKVQSNYRSILTFKVTETETVVTTYSAAKA
jgi:hypothetical protein